MKTFTICAALVAMIAVSACTTRHEKETIIEKQPDRTVIVVPNQ
jgi:hypothetical protein